MNRFNLTNAAKSVVTIYRSEDSTGMGVLVSGELILTAAHCLPRIPDPDDPFGDAVRVKFTRFTSDEKSVALVAGVDTCSDLAILANATARGTSLEGKEYLAFNKTLALLTPAEVCLKEHPCNQAIPIRVLTHSQEWINGQAVLYRPEDRFFDLTINTGCSPIGPGTSGAPVFDIQGRVIAIVSSVNEDEHSIESAQAARLAMALPAWILRKLSICQDQPKSS